MRKMYDALIYFIFITLFLGCSKQDKIPAHSLAIDKSEIVMGKIPGHTDFVTVTASEPWALDILSQSSGNWLQISSMSGGEGTTKLFLKALDSISPPEGVKVRARLISDSTVHSFLVVTQEKSFYSWKKFSIAANDFGTTASCVAPFGGFALLGTNAGGIMAEPNVMVKRMDEQGNLMWSKTFGGKGVDYGRAIIGTTDGGFVFVGSKEINDLGVVTGGSVYNMWVVRIDANGNQLWETIIGDVHNGTEDGVGVDIAKDGSIIVVGYLWDAQEGFPDYHHHSDAGVVKLDSKGNVLWKKAFGGYDGGDDATDVKALPEGGYLVIGSTMSTDGDVKIQHGYMDAWLLKIDEQGRLIWQKTIGGVDYDRGMKLLLGKNGDVFIAGYTGSTDMGLSNMHGSIDGWVAKMNAQGQITWQTAIGGSMNDLLYAFCQSWDGRLMVGGYTQSMDGQMLGSHGAVDNPAIDAEAWVSVLDDKDGRILWLRTIGGSSQEAVTGVSATPDGGFIFSGNTVSNDGDFSGLNPGSGTMVVGAFVTKVK